jgi:REP element-mobilizing transposase RayT
MPNHVHVLFSPVSDFSLSQIVQSWKSFTAKEANRILKRTGKFWQADYFDRYVRDQKHFDAALEYIEVNPVKAKLCRSAEDWRWSSARRRLVMVEGM